MYSTKFHYGFKISISIFPSFSSFRYIESFIATLNSYRFQPLSNFTLIRSKKTGRRKKSMSLLTKESAPERWNRSRCVPLVCVNFNFLHKAAQERDLEFLFYFGSR